MNLKDFRRKLMEDPEVEAAYRKLRPKLELGRQILELRLERGWTQKELARRAGTRQANISRLENALLNPSVEMLQKVANALEAQLVVQITPEKETASLAHEPARLAESSGFASTLVSICAISYAQPGGESVPAGSASYLERRVARVDTGIPAAGQSDTSYLELPFPQGALAQPALRTMKPMQHAVSGKAQNAGVRMHD